MAGIKLHKRTRIVTEAKHKIVDIIIKVSEEFDLTSSELVSILAEEILQYNKYNIRHERHGNYEKKGDEA